MTQERMALLPGSVELRHIKRVPHDANTYTSIGGFQFRLTDEFAREVLGGIFRPQPLAGVNGPAGFTKGSYEERINEEGAFTLVLPNAVGGDGVAHRDRLLILSTGANYRPGDEWFEIWRKAGTGGAGQLLFVGTPTKSRVTPSEIQLSGWDAVWLLRRAREWSSGYHVKSPHDVIDHYLRMVEVRLAEDFQDPTSPAFTYSAANQYTNDNQFIYSRVRNGTGVRAGQVELDPGVGNTAHLTGSTAYWDPTTEDTTTTPTVAITNRQSTDVDVLSGEGQGDTVRLETTLEVEDWVAPSNPNTGMPNIGLYLNADSGNSPLLSVRLAGGWFLGTPLQILASGSPGGVSTHETQSGLTLADKKFSLAIEIQGDVCLYYINERLIGINRFRQTTVPTRMVPKLYWVPAQGTATKLYVHSMMVRRTSRFLNRVAPSATNIRLPEMRVATQRAALPEGGLVGTYVDVGQLSESYPPPFFSAVDALHDGTVPGKFTPFARRLDADLRFSSLSGGYGNWMPPGAPYRQEYSAAVWTGSIWLDLDQKDYRFMNLALAGAVSVQVGNTVSGQYAYRQSTSGSLTAIQQWLKGGASDAGAGPGVTGPMAGQNRAGWYPIVIRYGCGSGASQVWLELQDSSLVSTALVNGLVGLSPLGVYEQRVRYDSHYEVVRNVLDTFGLQARMEPRSLESGSFPGEFRSAVRVGRDTEFVATTDTSTAVVVEVDAEDTVDSLLADAAGIATGSGESGQLTAEGVLYPSMGDHFAGHMDYESLAEITIPELLQRRLDSLVALRSSPWEQVGVQPPPSRQLLDSFPLTGALAEFAWRAGDGVRLDLPELGVVDSSPRQILGVQWEFSPDGVGPPTVAFRQRPRNLREMLRQIQRRSLQQIRNYQGQLVTTTSSHGSSASSGGMDPYARFSLPEEAKAVALVELVVYAKGGTASMDLYVNSVDTGVNVTRTGRYDITRFVRLNTGALDPRYNHSHLVGADGTFYYVEVLHRV